MLVLSNENLATAKVDSQNTNSTGEIKKSLPFKPVVQSFEKFFSSEPQYGKYCLYELTGSKVPYYVLTHLKGPKKRTIFFFTGAIQKKIFESPYLNRWGWAAKKELEGMNCIYFADPTVSIPSISCGWYLWDIIKEQSKISKMIEYYRKKLSLTDDQCIFIGSSAGGYAAIRYLLDFPKCSALVENIQSNPFEYHEFHVNNLLKGIPEIKNFDRGEFDLINRLKKSKVKPRIILIQNSNDEFHYNQFFLTAKKGLEGIKSITFIQSDTVQNRSNTHQYVIEFNEFLKILQKLIKEKENNTLLGKINSLVKRLGKK